MSVELNHTIVHATDRDATAAFLTSVLGLPDAPAYGPFRVVALSNGVSLDVMTARGPVTPQHYAFLVSDAEFDAIHARIVERGLTFWADPMRREAGRINHNDGGRGLYWPAPDDHNLEIITVPYGGAGA
ncbi:VOC family protein [Nocardioides ginsengisoli]|uniref:VOC family protein n=1 Tax=Nocardioides ginsengisoli TaxID=363868 RepID=A0ABW3W303_9ACTN